jgi:hypothetical protein
MLRNVRQRAFGFSEDIVLTSLVLLTRCRFSVSIAAGAGECALLEKCRSVLRRRMFASRSCEKGKMPEFESEKFEKCWKSTEIIREYQRMLFTFGDMEVPYVLVAEHGRYKDRAVITKGVVMLQRPQILLPSQYGGPQFQEGFELANAIPPDAAYLLRAMQLPYSQISNRPIAEEYMEYGSLQSVLDRFDTEMENQEDMETGLIKGARNGADISLMRYSLGLAIKSAPGNVKEFFEHLRRQRGEPIRPDERVTDEDIRRLFG